MEEEYWNRFTNSGSVLDYLNYKRERRFTQEAEHREAGADLNGPADSSDRDNFICGTYR